MSIPGRQDPQRQRTGRNEIDQVFIGSCTNGRLEDLAAAAEVLKGKKVADFVKLIVTPASRKICRQADEMGILDTLAEAGAIITHPGCGLCCGRTGGILTDGESGCNSFNPQLLRPYGNIQGTDLSGFPKDCGQLCDRR